MKLSCRNSRKIQFLQCLRRSRSYISRGDERHLLVALDSAGQKSHRVHQRNQHQKIFHEWYRAQKKAIQVRNLFQFFLEVMEPLNWSRLLLMLRANTAQQDHVRNSRSLNRIADRCAHPVSGGEKVRVLRPRRQQNISRLGAFEYSCQRRSVTCVRRRALRTQWKKLCQLRRVTPHSAHFLATLQQFLRNDRTRISRRSQHYVHVTSPCLLVSSSF